MDVAIAHLVEAIHDQPGQAAVVVAGAGSRFLAWLLGVAGASRTLLEAQVPYASSAFDQYLGQAPAQYVAPKTAAMLAGRALNRARQLGPTRNLGAGAEPLVGLACTATIATDRPKRGQHRAHVATWTAEDFHLYSLTLEKGARDRRGEEEVVSRLILRAMARAYGLDDRLALGLRPAERVRHQHGDVLEAAQRLLHGETACFAVTAEGQIRHDYRPKALLSGAFNPLHEGHLALAQTAQAITGRPVTFELAVVNAGKATITLEQTLDRLAQFAGSHPALASAAPRFDQKAELFPDTVFVVGQDTAARVLQPRFYQDSYAQMLAALGRIREAGCRFLVAGRADDGGNFHRAADLAAPEAFQDLFQAIPQEMFRLDISSTKLRRQGQAAA